MYQKFIEKILKEGAEIAKKHFGRVTPTVKPEDRNQVLTEADIAVGRALAVAISKEYPEYNIIDEETGVADHGSRYTWVVDPIDGTSNFAVGLPWYGILVGLLDGATPIAGGIALPAFGDVMVAEKGRGAWSGNTRLFVTKETQLGDVLVAYGLDGFPDAPEKTRAQGKILSEIAIAVRNIRLTNSAYDAAMIVEGKFGGMVNHTSKIWDNIGQQVVIEEAGGIYSDFFGKPMDYTNPCARAKENFTMCAAAPALHSALQKIIHHV